MKSKIAIFFAAVVFLVPFSGVKAVEQSSTFRIMTQSDSGDYIGQNKAWDFSDANNSKISVTSATQNQTTFRSENFDIDYMTYEFAAETGKVLVPGLYAPAKRFAFRDSYNGINISGDGRGCNTILGAFYIHEYVMTNGVLDKAAIDFAQICEPSSTNLNSAKPRLVGSLRYNSSVPDSCNAQGCAEAQKNLRLVSLGQFIAATEAGPYYVVGKSAENNYNRLVIPATDQAYQMAVMNSNNLSTSSLKVLPQSLVESLPVDKNLTIKAGSNFLLKKESTTDHYIVDHDNYLKPVNWADFTNYTLVEVPDAYFANYIVMAETKSDLIITGIEQEVKDQTINGKQYSAINFWVKYKNNSTVDIAKQFYISAQTGATSEYQNGFKESVPVQFMSTDVSTKAGTEYKLNTAISYLLPKGNSLNSKFVFNVDRNITDSAADNLIEESNENNNAFEKTVVIYATTSSLPDLVIRGVHLPSATDKRFVVEVKNAGLAATSFADGIKVSASVIDSNGALVALDNSGFQYVKNLAAGEFASATFNIIGKTTNDIKLKIWLDNAENGGSGFINESNESNNTFEKTITIGQADTDQTAASLSLISPDGGERLEIGKTYKVKWNYGGKNDYVKIYVVDDSIQGSGSTNYIVPDNASIPAEKGYYEWTINERSLPFGGRRDNYRIRIDSVNSQLSDISAKPFSIVPSQVKDDQITLINNNAKLLIADKVEQILGEIKSLRDVIKEQQNEIRYLRSLKRDIKNLTEKVQDVVNQFITYGVDDNTKKLGEGERAAVIYSYKSAFDKLPETEAELADAIKIANGRFPSLVSDKAEKRAKEQFIKIYKRVADMNDAKDAAAVKVMAYGLKQKAENRNLNSEKSGIKSFKAIFGNQPKSTDEWNAMQAITYSGASRKADSDGDLLADETERKLGTDPNKADSDGDGHKDGTEVNGGYNPRGK